MTSQAVREVQARLPDADRYEEMNLQDLPAKDVQKLVQAREGAYQEVAGYEQGPPPIEGVYLVYDRHGVSTCVVSDPRVVSAHVSHTRLPVDLTCVG